MIYRPMLALLALIPLTAYALDRPRHRATTPPEGTPIVIEGATVYIYKTGDETPPIPPNPGDDAHFTVDAPAPHVEIRDVITAHGAAGNKWRNVACWSPSAASGVKVMPDTPPAGGGWTNEIDTTRMDRGPNHLECKAFSGLPGQAGDEASVSVPVTVANAAPPAGTFTLGGYTFGAPAFEDTFTTMATIAGNVPTATAQYKWYASGNGFGATVSCCTGTNEPGNPSYDPYSLIPGGGLNITASARAGSWRTGLMSTVAGDGTGFKAKGGYWEGSFKFPAKQPGSWPAWWMLSSPNGNGNPPQTAEADIFEVFGTCGPQNNGQYNRAIASTYHLWNMPPNGQHEDGGHQDSMLDFDISADYHTYGLLWNHASVDIYVDRHLVYHNATPSVMQQPMYAIVNLAMNPCNDLAQATDPTVFSAKYIKIWTFPDVNGKGF
jgi:hypothetical protein